MNPPVFQIYSDRRGKSLLVVCCVQSLSVLVNPDADNQRVGGRTAWSSRVTIDGHSLSARYWYDGKYLHNAREDVAEVAYTWLTGNS